MIDRKSYRGFLTKDKEIIKVVKTCLINPN